MKIIFLCTENANRSQMAEGFARHHGMGAVEVWSAGSQASGQINPRAVEMMAEKGLDLDHQSSKSTAEVPPGPYDWVITMGCGDECPWLAGHQREDWGLPDPKHLPDAGFRQVRDEIESRVLDLLQRLKPGDGVS